jgi:hypothetical protein
MRNTKVAKSDVAKEPEGKLSTYITVKKHLCTSFWQ